jgi:hypothetical protein
MKLWILFFGLFLSNFAFAQTDSNPVKKILIGNDGNKAVLANGDTVAYNGAMPEIVNTTKPRRNHLVTSGNLFLGSLALVAVGGGLATVGIIKNIKALQIAGGAVAGASIITTVGGIVNIKLAGIELEKSKGTANLYLQPTGFSAKVTF